MRLQLFLFVESFYLWKSGWHMNDSDYLYIGSDIGCDTFDGYSRSLCVGNGLQIIASNKIWQGTNNQKIKLEGSMTNCLS